MKKQKSRASNKLKASDKKEPPHQNPAGSARYATEEEVRGEFHEVQRLASGGEQLRRKLSEHHADGPALSAGDIDVAWDQADIGEETVGGGNHTPDQDIVADVG
jgi:hypothetical protein